MFVLMLYCYDLLQKGYNVSSLVPNNYFVIKQQEHRVEETSLLTFLPNVKHEQVRGVRGRKMFNGQHLHCSSLRSQWLA